MVSDFQVCILTAGYLSWKLNHMMFDDTCFCSMSRSFFNIFALGYGGWPLELLLLLVLVRKVFGR